MKKSIFLALSCALCPALAQTPPQLSEPVRVLVSGSPGGPADTAIRVIAPSMASVLPRIIVDNRAAAGGQVAAEMLMNATPDGRTLMVGSSGSHAIVPNVAKNVPYDSLRDFTPITLIVTNGLVLVANLKVPANSFAELAASVRKEAAGMNIGVAGMTGELAAASLGNSSRIKLNRVRWNGAGPVEIGLLSGEVGIALLPPVVSVGHIRAGKMKGLGVTSPTRMPLLPAVPTIQELGLEGFDFQLWNGLFAPAKVPLNVVNVLHKTVNDALSVPDVRKRFEALGFTIVGNSPAEFSAIIKRDVQRFKSLIAETGIRGD